MLVNSAHGDGDETHFDKLIRSFKNRPMLSVVLLVGFGIVALGQLTGAIDSILDFVGKFSRPEYSQIEQTGAGSPSQRPQATAMVPDVQSGSAPAATGTDPARISGYTEPATLEESSQVTQDMRERILKSGRPEGDPKEVHLQEQPKGRNAKPLAGTFVRLFYFGRRYDDSLEVMARLARFGATVELHELNPDESYDHLGTPLRNSPCWEIVGKELESVIQNFKKARVQTVESCDSGSLDLFLEPHRSLENSSQPVQSSSTPTPPPELPSKSYNFEFLSIEIIYVGAAEQKADMVASRLRQLGAQVELTQDVVDADLRYNHAFFGECNKEIVRRVGDAIVDIVRISLVKSADSCPSNITLFILA